MTARDGAQASRPCVECGRRLWWQMVTRTIKGPRVRTVIEVPLLVDDRERAWCGEGFRARLRQDPHRLDKPIGAAS